jgi:teichuronic acid biosynthesis glycosyltransferase TuaC
MGAFDAGVLGREVHTMKVLVFTSLYPNNVWPHHGVFVKERTTHVAKHDGFRVKVVAPVPYFPPIKITQRWLFSRVLKQENRDGLEVFHPRYFMIPKIGMAFYGLMMFLSVLPDIKKRQRDFDFDLIDAHFIYPDGFAAVLLGAFFRRPVIVSARGSDINLYREFPIVRKLLRYTLCKADRVIAVSSALKGAMIQMGIPEEKVSVIPNGVDLNKFHPIPKDVARKRLGLPQKTIILSVGNLTPNKGFDLLVKALSILFATFHTENLYLVIIGEGGFRKKLEKLISRLSLEAHVHLTGDIPHEALNLWYSAADLFCLASRREGWPNVLLESLACSTPVVATAVGGIPEIISSDSLGLLTHRSTREIAAGISRALNKSWQGAALRRYAEEHTWDRVALELGHVYKSALGDRGMLTHEHAMAHGVAATPAGASQREAGHG